jgi:hypothetical protein
MLKQLGLDGLVLAEVRNWFGPFVRAQAAESKTEHFVALPAKQATPLIFTSHFFLRLHRQLMPLLRRSRGDIEWVDWALGNIRIARFRNSQDGERKPLGQSSR